VSIYTKAGDKGYTSLAKIPIIFKSDDRIQLLGNMDELTSNLGIVKANDGREEVKIQIERIQKNLIFIMSGIADQFNSKYKFSEEEVIHMEDEINAMENLFSRKKEFILPGSCALSAQIDVARTVARRAERWLNTVDQKFGVDQVAKKYTNRLADYLYMLARYTDERHEKNEDIAINQVPIINTEQTNLFKEETAQTITNKLWVVNNRINLEDTKKLMRMIEEEAKKRGLNVVIAVCNPEGNPIAVHAMDGSFLASFDVAMKKAYTSVAVKMTTKKLGELAIPGGTFYGIDKADQGRLIIFGGGVPLFIGDIIIGGLGISGGTSQEDASLAEYGEYILAEIVGRSWRQ
jgi:ATP:cob(I)alamin adenosyltransferase